MRIMKEILRVLTRLNPGREKKNAEISAFLGVMSRYEKKKAKTLIHRLNNFSLGQPVWTQFFFLLLLCKL